MRIMCHTARAAALLPLTAAVLLLPGLQVRAQTAPPSSAGKQKGEKDKVAFVTLRLKGLHCAGCAMAVKKSLLALTGVASAEVSAQTQTAVVELAGDKQPKEDVLKAAVKKAGYEVVAIEKGKPKATAVTDDPKKEPHHG